MSRFIFLNQFLPPLAEHQIQAQIHKVLCSFYRLRFPVPHVMLSLGNPLWKVLLTLRSGGLLTGKEGDAELNTMLSSAAAFIGGETQGMSGNLNKTNVWSVKLRVTRLL